MSWAWEKFNNLGAWPSMLKGDPYTTWLVYFNISIKSYYLNVQFYKLTPFMGQFMCGECVVDLHILQLNLSH